MKRILLSAFMLLTGIVANVSTHAGEATDALHAFFDQVHSLRAKFTQELFDRQKGALQHASGTVAIQRPGRFRWDYLQPYRQQIVADGEKLWFYDTDLEQVTVKPLEEGLGSTPAFLLTGGEALESRFDIVEIAPLGGAQRVELTPKEREGQFDTIRLTFKGESLTLMEVVDSFGQTTRIAFSDVERNPSLPAGLFRFVPPPGVDVLGAGR
ncbi:outer membrane lipoprotein chaperone LolA [Endothiovibrio diazotrophicus]